MPPSQASGPPATKVMLRHLPPSVTEEGVAEMVAKALSGSSFANVKASIVYLEKGKTK